MNVQQQPDFNLMGVDWLPTLFFCSISWLVLMTILLRMRMLVIAAELEIQKSTDRYVVYCNELYIMSIYIVLLSRG